MNLEEQAYFQKHNQSALRDIKRINRYVWVIALFWTLTVGAMLGGMAYQQQQEVIETARGIARAAFEKDVLYRRWNAELGGLYAEVSDTMRPNPYLKDIVSERDIVTPSGRQLTLVNPSYMTRQVFELGSRDGALAQHITSLTPLRPANAADSWETAALQQFEQGSAEISSIEMINGEEVMRYMRPLYAKSTCLKCHEQQGYKIGDVRGGISVTVPMSSLRDAEYLQGSIVITGGLLLWAIGMLGLFWGGVRLRRDTRRRMAMEQQLSTQSMQLQQMQKMESIGVLAGGVAHDFNNILTAINGYAELALMGSPKAAIQRDLESVIVASNRAKKLTSQLLAFSRKQIYKPVALELNTVIEEIEPMLRRLISEDINIETVYAADLPLINADPTQIEQILVNLVVNARDAVNECATIAAEKGITIKTGQVYLDEHYVATHAGSKTGKHVLFSVSDTGIGMDEKTKDRVFEPFFTTKEQGHGTGLGLATVFGIVKQNDANIYIDSEVGVGTTFKIYWPILDAPISLSAEKVSAVDDHDYFGTETILLVEDDTGVREFAESVLSGLGYRVLLAEDGTEALDMVSKLDGTLDLLVTDVIMPHMNGDELAEILRKQLPTLRILFASGYTDNHIVHSGALKSGMNFLQKPYSIGELSRRVREVLDKIND